MRLVSWSIINNEIDFIKDVVEYHAEYLDGLYLLDTGSQDGTWEYLQSLNHPNIVVEQYHTHYTPDYSVCWEEMREPFPEAEVRNHAIQRCKQLFGLGRRVGDFMLQVDGDEIFLPKVKEIIEANPTALSISHSTINPCCSLDKHPIEKRWGKDRNLIRMYDPHCRIWNAAYDIKYINNYELKNVTFHCVPALSGNKRHMFETQGNIFVPDILHYHLHWLYGNKLQQYYAKQGITDLQEIKSRNPLNDVSHLMPERFLQRREEWYKD